MQDGGGSVVDPPHVPLVRWNKNPPVSDGKEGSRGGTSDPYHRAKDGCGVAPKKRPEYEIQEDTTGHFSVGQIIPDPHYNSIKEDYDIRMKEWPGSETRVHISGRKRDLIKGFLEEKRYAITAEYYHYVVRARGKNVDTGAISLKIQGLGLKFLRVRVIGETGPDGDLGDKRFR